MKLVIANSKAVYKDLISEGLPKEKIELIYNGIDKSNHAYNTSFIKKLKLTSSTLKIIVVSNLVKI